MQYREYGTTGDKVSLLSFGGMRFANVDDRDECARMMVAAARGGVNYFDTAPGYFEGRSEKAFAVGLAELRRLGLPHFVSSKTFASRPDEIRRDLEATLKRMELQSLDFYHIWCVTELDNWRRRKTDGVLETFAKLKEEGLIRHVCISSHLIRDEIRELLMEGVFEGVLFGYSAYNFQTRQAAFDAIREKKLGAVVMNPLGGGVIPRNEEKFAFLKRPGEGIVAAALGFIWDHRDITTTLVGFDTIEHVREALDAMENYVPRTDAQLDELKARASSSFEGICTGCAYCDGCPMDIPIPKLMDAYNQKILGGEGGGKEAIANRLRWHWGGIDASVAGACTACGRCESACTQHLNIIERLREIAG